MLLWGVIAVRYCWKLLRGVIEGCHFGALLRDVIAVQGVIAGVIAGRYCGMLLWGVIPGCYCGM
jgi:hypothetical protein